MRAAASPLTPAPLTPAPRPRSARNKEAYFTDDGFATGVAFILAILKQNDVFASLHWFDSLRLRLEEEAQSIAGMRHVRATDDVKQEVAYREAKLQATRREIDLLYFSFTGARVFFKE